MSCKVQLQSDITASVELPGVVGTLASARASALGANLSRRADLHIITTCANRLESVALPTEGKDLVGHVKTISNKGASSCRVYPDTGGIITVPAVGSLGADNPLILDANSQVKLVCTNGRDWDVLEKQGGVIETLADAAVTITTGETGKTFILPECAADRIITLPAPTRGAKYKFVTNASATTGNWNITSTGANVRPFVYMRANGVADGQMTSLASAACTTVRFADGVANDIGKYCDLESDGTLWYAKCFSNAAAAFEVA